MSKDLTTSEALNILYAHEDIQGGHDDYWEAYRFIEKHIKALEIIKDCCIVAEYPTLEEENKYELSFCNKICISKEEYDLLKEVLI